MKMKGESMSHVSALKVRVKNLDALRQAASELGLEFVEGQKTFKWYGRWMNDWHGESAAYRQGIEPSKYGTCDHAIRIPGAAASAYEIGVVAVGDGTYVLCWDNWQGGFGLADRIGASGEKLAQTYIKNVIIRKAEQKGYKITNVEILEKGQLKVHMQQKM